MITDKPSIAELQRIEREMTPGKWVGGADCVTVYKDRHERGTGTVLAEMIEPDRHEDNAQGIAALRNAAPVLLEIAQAALELAGPSRPGEAHIPAWNALLAATAKVRP